MSRTWGEKPYRSLDYECKTRFGAKTYKISLDAGFTCPNRDGKLGKRGCIFCSAGGSGDFTAPKIGSISHQIDLGIAGISSRKSVGEQFIAYFQAFTNTYAPVTKLRPLYEEALHHPKVVALDLATRPDCLPEDVLDLLSECNEVKPVWVELGLQTIHKKTADYIRRGYDLPVFEKALTELRARGIDVIVHVILGLPGETYDDFMETIWYLSRMPIQGIKLQLLHVLKGTDLAKEYGTFPILTMAEYIEWVTTAVAHLPESITIHRLTGDGPKDLLIAPTWSSRKREVLNGIHAAMKQKDLWQGKLYLDDFE